MKPEDAIKLMFQMQKPVGYSALEHMIYLYYVYLKNFHIRPFDIRDMLDGLLYLEVSNKQQAEAMRRERG